MSSLLSFIIFIIFFLIYINSIKKLLLFKPNPHCGYIKIFIVSSDNVSDDYWSKGWEKFLNPNIPIIWTDKIKEADYIFVVNGVNEKHSDFVSKNKSKTIVAHMEPSMSPLNDVKEYLAVWTHDIALNNMEWYYSIPYVKIKELIPFETKTHDKILTAVVSSSYTCPGHIFRIDFLKYLENEWSDKITLHIYGRGNKFNFKNYKGELKEKSDALLTYKYHFNAESNYQKNYITEKFYDPILCETFLFYVGAPNVEQVFPSDAYMIINPNDFHSSALQIYNAIQSDIWKQTIDNIRKLKDYALTEYSMTNRIYKVIQHI